MGSHCQQEYEDILLYTTSQSYRDLMGSPLMTREVYETKLRDMLCSNNVCTCLRRTALACDRMRLVVVKQEEKDRIY